MPIVKKSDLKRHIMELEARYEKLRKAVNGTEPNPNIYNQYHNNPDQYKDEFIEISLDDVHYAVNDFNHVLKKLNNINSMKALKISKK